MADSDFRFPRADQHVSVMGRNGSGKTYMGVFLLSQSDLNERPHIIFDYKRDELLNELPHVQEISIHKPPPERPGLYIVHPNPGKNNDAATEHFLWQVWAQENTALYFDEAYMLPDIEAYPSILTQGRSKHVSTINLTQRPAWISRFVFTESTHYSIFHLNDKDDRKKVQRFVPDDKGASLEKRLPRHHSYWYDVGEDNIFLVQPVPNRDRLLSIFDARIVPKRKFFFQR